MGSVKKSLLRGLALMLCLAFALVGTGLAEDSILFDGTQAGVADAIFSAGVLDDTLYLQGNLALYTYRLGDGEPVPLITAEQEDVSGYRLVNGPEGLLYALDLGTGRQGTLSPEGIAWSDELLPLEELRLEDNAAAYLNLYIDDGDGLLVMQVGGSNFYELSRLNKSTGKVAPLNIPYLIACAPHSPGKVMALSLDYNKLASGEDLNNIALDLYLVDAQTGQILETLAALKGLTGGGMLYDGAQDAIYAVSGGEVVRLSGGQQKALAVLSADSGTYLRFAGMLGDTYVMSSVNGTYLRTISEDGLAAQPLRITGLFTETDVLAAFERDHPEVPVVVEQSYLITSQDIQGAIATGDSAADILVLYHYTLKDIMEKGYLQDLSASPVLMAEAEAMYPQIQELLYMDEKLYAYPMLLQVPAWSVRDDLLDEYGLELPETYLDFIRAIGTWEEEHSDLEELKYVSLYMGQLELFSSALYAYAMTYETAEAPLSFNTPAFQEVLRAIAELPLDKGVIEDPNEAVQAVLSAQQRQAILNMNNADPLGQYTRYLDPETTPRTIAPPAFEAGADPQMRAIMMVYAVNPNSQNREQAMAFLEYVAQHKAAPQRYLMSPQLMEPVQDEQALKEMVGYEEQLAELNDRLATAEEVDKGAIEDEIARVQSAIAATEATSYILSRENIDNYRAIAPYMNLMPGSVLVNVDNQEATGQINEVIMRYINDQIPLEQALRELDQKIQMMFMER